jgi:predicted amidohydrolase
VTILAADPRLHDWHVCTVTMVPGQGGHAIKIAVHAVDGVTMFHLSVPQMVFDEVARLGLGDWTTELFSDRPGSIVTAEGYTVGRVAGLAAVDDADLDGRRA